MNSILTAAATRGFDVYGCRFSVDAPSAELMDGICQDFAFFACNPGDFELKVELFAEDPDWSRIPAADASVYTPRNVVYRDGGTRYIDYHGRGLAIHDQRGGSFRMYSRDEGLLYEAVYLFLLSHIGRKLDQMHIHRVHALGAELRGKAILVMLPMGGGKSTLGLHLLRIPQVRILSDDSPWIDSKGRVLAYPLRLGLLPGSEQAVPPQHRRTIQRMEFSPKHLVNYSYFQDRVSPAADPGIVFVGVRSSTADCRIEELRWAGGLGPAISNCVIGVGLFQGLEFILQSSALELAGKAGLGLSRLRNCWQLLRRSRVCRVHLGRDPQRNAQCVYEYAERYL